MRMKDFEERTLPHSINEIVEARKAPPPRKLPPPVPEYKPWKNKEKHLPDPLRGTSAQVVSRTGQGFALPRTPCIAVNHDGSKGLLGHATVYIAANALPERKAPREAQTITIHRNGKDEEIRVNQYYTYDDLPSAIENTVDELPPIKMVYMMTDLTVDKKDSRSVPYFRVEQVSGWANPATSKTWSISQVRAENAIATALRFSRMSCISHRFEEDETVDEEDEDQRFETRGALMPAARLKDLQAFHTGKKARAPIYKYGILKVFLETNNPTRHIKGGRREYMTCATYAETILKAAGIETPGGYGLQSARNLARRDNKVLRFLDKVNTSVSNWLVTKLREVL